MTPEEMVSRLLYRDGLMLVIDKPAGMAVHRGPKGGESLEDHFGALRFGLPRAPALAHRLDRDTSGCLVLGRHRKALAALGRMFKNGQIGKTYWAVVEGGPQGDAGRIDLPLGRLDATRGWWMKADENGLPAATAWTVMGRSYFTSPLAGEVGSRSDPGGESVVDPRAYPPPQPSPTRGEGEAAPANDTRYAWLALEPLTGRTHQLRVHCAAMGWPIVGDTIYGDVPRAGGPALHLHSREIVVPISKNREPVRVIAPVPAPMHERLAMCGWNDDAAPVEGSRLEPIAGLENPPHDRHADREKQ